MFDNDKKLILEIYENTELGLPAQVLSGDSSMELLNPYLKQIPIEGKRNQTLLRAQFLKLGVPIEYWKPNAVGKVKSIICFYLVKTKKAKWLSFDADAMNPEKSLENFKKINCINMQKISVEKKKEKNNKPKDKEIAKTKKLDHVLPSFLR